MSRCNSCTHRFTCDGDDCRYTYDIDPEDTEERYKEWLEDQKAQSKENEVEE